MIYRSRILIPSNILTVPKTILKYARYIRPALELLEFQKFFNWQDGRIDRIFCSSKSFSSSTRILVMLAFFWHLVHLYAACYKFYYSKKPPRKLGEMNRSKFQSPVMMFWSQSLHGQGTHIQRWLLGESAVF